LNREVVLGGLAIIVCLLLLSALVAGLIYFPWQMLAVVLFGAGIVVLCFFPSLYHDGLWEGMYVWGILGLLPGALIQGGMFAAFDGVHWWSFVPPALVVSGCIIWGSERFKPIRARWFKQERLCQSLLNYRDCGFLTGTRPVSQDLLIGSWTDLHAAAVELYGRRGLKQLLPCMMAAWDKAASEGDVQALEGCQAILLALGWTPQSAEHKERLGLAEQIRSQTASTTRQIRGFKDNEESDVRVLTELCAAYTANNQQAIKSLESKATRIGRKLHRRGGLEEMRRIFRMLPDVQGKRTLEMHWHGIGDWFG